MNLSTLPVAFTGVRQLTMTTQALAHSMGYPAARVAVDFLKDNDIDYELSVVQAFATSIKPQTSFSRGVVDVCTVMEKQVAQLYSLLALSSRSFWMWRRFVYDDQLIRQIDVVRRLHRVLSRRTDLLFRSVSCSNKECS